MDDQNALIVHWLCFSTHGIGVLVSRQLGFRSERSSRLSLSAQQRRAAARRNCSIRTLEAIQCPRTSMSRCRLPTISLLGETAAAAARKLQRKMEAHAHVAAFSSTARAFLAGCGRRQPPGSPRTRGPVGGRTPAHGAPLQHTLHPQQTAEHGAFPWCCQRHTIVGTTTVWEGCRVQTLRGEAVRMVCGAQ